MRFIYILLLTLVVNSVFAQKTGDINYTINEDQNLVITRTINTSSNSDSSAYEILKQFMLDYYSDSGDFLTSILDSEYEMKAVGENRVSKDGFFNSDKVTAHYFLKTYVKDRQIHAEFTFTQYKIEDYNALCSCYTSEKMEKITSHYPINADGSKKMEYSFNSIFKRVDRIIDQLAKSVASNMHINEYVSKYPIHRVEHLSGTHIVTIDHDTISVKLLKMKFNSLKCEVNGEVVTYRPKGILSYIHEGSIFDSGRLKDKALGFKSWKFLQKVVDGELSLYYVFAYERSVSGRPDDHFYNGNELFYIRKKQNIRGDFKRVGASWKKGFSKVCADCPELVEVIKNDGYWNPNYTKYVNFYNIKCVDARLK